MIPVGAASGQPASSPGTKYWFSLQVYVVVFFGPYDVGVQVVDWTAAKIATGIASMKSKGINFFIFILLIM